MTLMVRDATPRGVPFTESEYWGANARPTKAQEVAAREHSIYSRPIGGRYVSGFWVSPYPAAPAKGEAAGASPASSFVARVSKVEAVESRPLYRQWRAWRLTEAGASFWERFVWWNRELRVAYGYTHLEPKVPFGLVRNDPAWQGRSAGEGRYSVTNDFSPYAGRDLIKEFFDEFGPDWFDFEGPDADALRRGEFVPEGASTTTF